MNHSTTITRRRPFSQLQLLSTTVLSDSLLDAKSSLSELGRDAARTHKSPPATPTTLFTPSLHVLRRLKAYRYVKELALKQSRLHINQKDRQRLAGFLTQLTMKFRKFSWNPCIKCLIVIIISSSKRIYKVHFRRMPQIVKYLSYGCFTITFIYTLARVTDILCLSLPHCWETIS